jgi:hypothetical protein
MPREHKYNTTELRCSCTGQYLGSRHGVQSCNNIAALYKIYEIVFWKFSTCNFETTIRVVPGGQFDTQRRFWGHLEHENTTQPLFGHGWHFEKIPLQGGFLHQKFQLWLARNGPQLAPRELKLALFDSKWANLAWFAWKVLIWLTSKRKKWKRE